VKTLGDGYVAKRIQYKTGKEIKIGESPNGLYAIMSRAKGVALRISLIEGIADLYDDKDSRYLAEAWIINEEE
jgi:hypothetical protein